MNETGVSVGDALGLMNRNNNCGMFGSGDSWIGLIIILALLGGGGFGGWGGNNAAWNGALTRAELYDSQQLQTIQMNQNQNQRDMCQSTATLSNQINSRAYEGQIANNNAFSNVVNGITQLGYQMQDCCCQTQRAIDGVNYNMQTNAMNIIQSQNNGTQKILDKLCSMEMNAKDAKIAELNQIVTNQQFHLSQTRQNQYLVGELAPKPIPAYPVQNPCAPAGWFGNGCIA